MSDSTIPKNPASAVRRALLWWFKHPANAHVSINFAIDFTHARAYLDGLAQGQGPRVSVQHLLAAAIARTLAEHPLANAQVVANRIRMRDTVGIAMPVNLLGHPGGTRRELGLMVLTDAQTLSLRQVAERSTRTVRAERSGKSSLGLVRLVMGLAERSPQEAFFTGMDLYEAVRQWPLVSDLFFRVAPVTTLLSNAGAPFQQAPGVLFRGGALSVPTRLGHVGTVWGMSTVQDEVIAVDGRAEVRPMLPVLILFDHRLIDGVAAGKLALRFAEILRDPASIFGEDGERVPERGRTAG